MSPFDSFLGIKGASFSLLPVPVKGAAYALAGLTLFLIWDQQYWWRLRAEYAFGFIVPLFVAFILFERWPKIIGYFSGDANRNNQGEQLFPGMDILLQAISLLMIVSGLLAFLIGLLYRAMEGQNLISSNALAIGYAVIVLAGVFFYSDRDRNGTQLPLENRWQVTMLFLFPAIIWMLSVPMFNAVHTIVSTYLMNKVATVVYLVFDLLGFAVVREGSVLRLPLGDIGVEDACSGIRSLTASLFAGSFLGAVYFDRLWKKVFLVGAAMLLAFVNNILRSIFLTAWAYAHGPEGLEGRVMIMGIDLGNIHDITGWIVLALTILGLVLLIKICSIKLEYKLPEEEQNENSVTNE